MRTLRNSILFSAAVFFAAGLAQAQDLSKYRGFSLGASLDDVLKLSGEKLADVKTIHARPVLIQELPWWPFSTSDASYKPDGVQQLLFSFANGELYRISVTYERNATEGLTVADMVNSIAEKYGPATKIASGADFTKAQAYDQKQTPFASWQNSQYSVDLIRSPYGESFGLMISAKAAAAAADLSIAEAVKLEELQRPEKEADEKKKKADALELTREKNRQSFRP